MTTHLFLVDAPDTRTVPETETIGLLIGSGDALTRGGLEALLNLESDIAVLGSAADPDEVLALAAQTRPDILVIDMAIDAVEVTRRLAANPETWEIRTLILGTPEHDDDVFSSLRAGASGFLPSGTEPTELIHAVRTVAAGEPALSPRIVRRLIAELASRPDPRLPAPEQLNELTPREREVVALVATGMSNDEIAEHLVVARATAKTHVSRALMKLRARDRAQLVTLAYESGLVLPKTPLAASPVGR
jgi:DNA-binding NarL/FixJ family response regulator